jgi:hypothetical protein
LRGVRAAIVAVGKEYVIHILRHIVICGLFGPTILLHIIS